MALAPRTVQNIPDCLRREPMTVLQPASNDAGADKQMLATEFGIAPALGISLKVFGLGANLLGNFDSG